MTCSPPSAPWQVLHAILLGVFWLLAGCDRTKGEATALKPAAGVPETRAARAPVLLEIEGFNYTDLYIDSFEVNGRGGGNLLVSDTESGGGGGACCVSLLPDGPLPVQLRISWTRDGRRRCEQDVELKGPLPASPRHLGVHFFPDGHIEAEVTEDYPKLRLRLERVDTARRKASNNTVEDEHFARCHDAE